MHDTDQLLTVTHWGHKVEVTTALESQKLKLAHALMLQPCNLKEISNSDYWRFCSLPSSHIMVVGWLSQDRRDWVLLRASLISWQQGECEVCLTAPLVRALPLRR